MNEERVIARTVCTLLMGTRRASILTASSSSYLACQPIRLSENHQALARTLYITPMIRGQANQVRNKKVTAKPSTSVLQLAIRAKLKDLLFTFSLFHLSLPAMTFESRFVFESVFIVIGVVAFVSELERRQFSASDRPELIGQGVVPALERSLALRTSALGGVPGPKPT